MEKMEIFIIWHGQRGNAVAAALTEWLPQIVNAFKPWFSSSAEKGSRWRFRVAARLTKARAGIICLTPSALTAPWVLFEAGAIAKSRDKTHACTLLIDLKSEDPLWLSRCAGIVPTGQSRLKQAGREAGKRKLPKPSSAMNASPPRVSRSVSPLDPPASCCLLIGNCRSPLPLPGSSHSPSFRNLLGCYDAPDTYTHLLIDETVTVWVYRSISIPRSELLCLLAWVGQPEIDIHPALPEQVDCRLDSG